MSRANEAIAQVRKFIQEIHRGLAGQPSQDPIESMGLMFQRDGLGGLRLNREEAAEYESLLQQLEAGFASDETISRRHIERHLQVAILEAIQEPSSFPGELEACLKKLRAALGAPPRPFDLYVPLLGLDPKSLPNEFGGVTFHPGRRIDNVLSAMMDYEGPDREIELVRRQRSMERLRTQFVDAATALTTANATDPNEALAGAAIAQVTVDAVDPAAAEELAVRKIGLAVDVLNFYSDLLHGRFERALVMLADEYPSKSLPLFVRSDTARNARFTNRGPRGRLSLKVNPQIAEKFGFHRASSLISRAVPKRRAPKEPTLYDRLLASLRWAGRGTAENDIETAFLLYAIALEAIVTTPQVDSDLTTRLRVRTAHLLGSNLEQRKLISRLVKTLYHKRSQIVHRGRTDVTDSDVGQMRWIAKSALVALLTREPFLSMTSSEELEQWFEEQPLGASSAG